MAKTKTVKIVRIEGINISNETCQPVRISFEESTLDHIAGTNKYSFVEVYTILATLTAKTFRQLNQDVEIWSAENQVFDFHAILVN